MTEQEIVRRYKADKTAGQIKILAELNAVPVKEIEDILRENGMEIVKRKRRSKKGEVAPVQQETGGEENVENTTCGRKMEKQGSKDAAIGRREETGDRAAVGEIEKSISGAAVEEIPHEVREAVYAQIIRLEEEIEERKDKIRVLNDYVSI